MSLSLAVSALVALWAVVTIYIRKARAQYPLPPGPKPLPLIGNLLDIPLKNEAATYNAWANKYGSFFIHRRVPFNNRAEFKVIWYMPAS